MFASVLINTTAKKLNKVFDYIVPKDMEDILQIGDRVWVPFGKGENLSEARGFAPYRCAQDYKCAGAGCSRETHGQETRNR